MTSLDNNVLKLNKKNYNDNDNLSSQMSSFKHNILRHDRDNYSVILVNLKHIFCSSETSILFQLSYCPPVN